MKIGIIAVNSVSYKSVEESLTKSEFQVEDYAMDNSGKFVEIEIYGI